MIFSSGCFAVCATTAQQTPLVNKPVVTAAAGPKDLFLSINGYESDEPQNAMDLRPMLKHAPVTFRPNREKVIPQKITLVNVKNNFRKTIARRVISVYAGDILIDALRQELKAAGYTVRLVHKLPKNAGNGIDVTSVYVDLEETSGLLTSTGTCNLQIKFEIWRKGTKLNSHDYASTDSNYSFFDEQHLFVDLMNLSSQKIMGLAGPDILNDLSEKLK